MSKASPLLLSFLLLLTTVNTLAQDRWENYFEAGIQALNEGNLPKAELLLKSARLKAELEAEAGNPRATEMMLDSYSAVALVLRQQGKTVEAETVLREQLDLLKSARIGDDDPQTSTTLHNLGLVLFDQKKYEDAGNILEKAVKLRRKFDAEPQRNLAISLLSLGGAYFHRGKVQEAESVVLQAREILFKVPVDKKTPADKAAVMRSDHNLALIYVANKKYDAAEKSYKSAIVALEELHGPNSQYLIMYLNNYATLLKVLQRDAEAKALETRIDKIRKENQ